MLPDRPQLPNVAHPAPGDSGSHLFRVRVRPLSCCPTDHWGAVGGRGGRHFVFPRSRQAMRHVSGRGAGVTQARLREAFSTWISSLLLSASATLSPQPSSQIDLEIPFPTSRAASFVAPPRKKGNPKTKSAVPSVPPNSLEISPLAALKRLLRRQRQKEAPAGLLRGPLEQARVRRGGPLGSLVSFIQSPSRKGPPGSSSPTPCRCRIGLPSLGLKIPGDFGGGARRGRGLGRGGAST
ncbi:UNVERIFIED_CONTAM: hypothetical protein K2H54_073994 [Gekko kuhli]